VSSFLTAHQHIIGHSDFTMCTYSRYSSMVQTRGVCRPLPVHELMLFTSGASAISCVFHMQHTSRTTKSDAGPANHQPLFLSRQDGCVCSDTLPLLVHLKPTRGLYEQLSVVCLWTGNARLVHQDEPGFERLSSASTRRASVRRNVPSGVNSWRQLCPVKDAPLVDDDDDECHKWWISTE